MMCASLATAEKQNAKVGTCAQRPSRLIARGVLLTDVARVCVSGNEAPRRPNVRMEKEMFFVRFRPEMKMRWV
jgi:hypothetical protein